MLNLDSGLVKPIYRLARPNQQHGPQAKFKPISFVKPQLGDSTLSFSFFFFYILPLNMGQTNTGHDG